MRLLTLISRQHCDLCDQMQTALELVQGSLAFGLEVVLLDKHPELEGRFGEFVPVLLDGEQEVCHYFLDHEKLAAHLAAVR